MLVVSLHSCLGFFVVLLMVIIMLSFGCFAPVKRLHWLEESSFNVL